MHSSFRRPTNMLLPPIDNYSVKGLRLSVSGYYGHAFNNTLMADNGKYKDVKGAVAIGSFGFDYRNSG